MSLSTYPFSRGKHRCRIFNELVLPLGELVFAEIVSSSQCCLGTFTAESLKNNLGFKLRGEFFLSVRMVLYHNLGLGGVLISDVSTNRRN